MLYLILNLFFLSNICTLDAITKFSDNIYNCFNNGEFMISVLLDFKKAFDTVDHDILQGKLHKLVLEEWNMTGLDLICIAGNSMLMWEAYAPQR